MSSSNPEVLQLHMDEEIFDAEVKPSYWVNQSNKLVNMTHQEPLTIYERRLISILIALVQPDDKDFKTFVIKVKDLADLIGISGHSIYKKIEEAIDGLMKKQLVLYSNDGKQSIVDKLQWVQRATYLKGDGSYDSLFYAKAPFTLSEYFQKLLLF